jgi:hypothetical protein
LSAQADERASVSALVYGRRTVGEPHELDRANVIGWDDEQASAHRHPEEAREPDH